MRTAIALLAAGTLATSAQAVTDVMGFEDLVVNPTTDFVLVPDGYHGLQWQGVRVFDPAAFGGGVYYDDYDQGISSGKIVASSSPVMSISSDAPFDFVGAFLSSAASLPVGLAVLGTTKDGTVVYAQSYQLSETSGQFYSFGFLGVNRLTFTTDASWQKFSMDDFTINTPVPEPAWWALMIAGLAVCYGAVGAAQARRAPLTRMTRPEAA